MKHKEQRVLVLFDVQNMYYSVKHFYDTKVNFKEILKSAVAGRKLIRAIAYVIKTDIKDEKNFHEALNKMGIEVKAKDIQIFPGGAKKGDWDIGIAMDAIRLASKVDTLVLVSGDGDFAELLRYMKSHGCRCEVIALGQTASKHIRDESDDFLDIGKNTAKYLIKARKAPRKAPSKTPAKPLKRAPIKTIAKPAKPQTPPRLHGTDMDEVQKSIIEANLDQVK